MNSSLKLLLAAIDHSHSKAELQAQITPKISEYFTAKRLPLTTVT